MNIKIDFSAVLGQNVSTEKEPKNQLEIKSDYIWSTQKVYRELKRCKFSTFSFSDCLMSTEHKTLKRRFLKSL